MSDNQPNREVQPVSDSLRRLVETVSYPDQPTDPKDFLTEETAFDPDDEETED